MTTKRISLHSIKERLEKINEADLKDAIAYAIYNANNDKQNPIHNHTYRDLCIYLHNELDFILRVAEKT